MTNTGKTPTQSLPRHLGLILDGNRRWAKDQGLPSLKGHEAGYKNLKTISKHAFNSGVEVVSAYVFSTENWNRTQEEVGYLMRLVPIMASEYLKELQDDGIRMMVLGSRDRVSDKVLKVLDDTVVATANNKGGILCLCFNYGGQQEIVDAAKLALANKKSSDQLEVADLQANLYGGSEIPPMDLIIRTSGEQRLSGFMLWRAAYSELFFVDKHWPAFTPKDLDLALKEYASRHRRFGV